MHSTSGKVVAYRKIISSSRGILRDVRYSNEFLHKRAHRPPQKELPTVLLITLRFTTVGCCKRVRVSTRKYSSPFHFHLPFKRNNSSENSGRHSAKLETNSFAYVMTERSEQCRVVCGSYDISSMFRAKIMRSVTCEESPLLGDDDYNRFVQLLHRRTRSSV